MHSDQVGISMMVGQAIRKAGQLGLLTDQNVIDATNTTDLKNSIDTNAAVSHSDVRNHAYNLKVALDLGLADGTLADASVAAATGIDNLASLTQSAPGKLGPGVE